MKNVKYVNQDQIFIDRSGLLFGHILQYLRTYLAPNRETLTSLKSEAEFYQMDGLALAIDYQLKGTQQKKQEEYRLVPLKQLLDQGELDFITQGTAGKFNTKSYKVIQAINVVEKMNVCTQPHASTYSMVGCQHSAIYRRDVNMVAIKLLVRKNTAA